MSSSTTKGGGKAASPETPAGQPFFPVTVGAGRLPLVPALAWLGILVLAFLLQGLPAFGVEWILDLVFTLGLCAAELAFLDAIYRKGKGSLLSAWKKFTGYALVLAYVFQSLPRVAWRNDGLIGEGRTVFLYALSLASLAAGLVVFFLLGRPAVQAAFGLITPEEVKDRALRKKNRAQRRKPGFLHGLLEWVDAIAFAAIAVIVINIFVFQLYVIPSESMVPSFLMGDRPFTLKLTMGPRLPLTEWRLPILDPPKRGDIVTIANPRFEENHEVNIKKQLSQFVYMLTFTAVNLNKDENGQDKPDPLVKRVVGMPGDRLMMIDDVVYARREGEAGFTPLEADRKWARVDLWKGDVVPVSKIKQVPIDEATRTLLSAWDARKNGLAPAQASASLRLAADRVLATAAKSRGRAEPVPSSMLAGLRDEAIRGASSGGAAWIGVNGVAWFMGGGTGSEDLAVALALAAARDAKVAEAVAAFARDGAAALLEKPADAYERGGRAFSALLKANLAARVERALELLPGGGLEALASDEVMARLGREAWELGVYFRLYDSRNFPVFPSGDRYLGPDEYFAMGDNRYNSLDFRYDDRTEDRVLDPADGSGIHYRSAVAPFALKREFIEGKASFILWPFSRAGAIRQ